MCLSLRYINNDYDRKVYIADKDIVVFKNLSYSVDSEGTYRFTSPFRCAHYTPGQTKKVRFFSAYKDPSCYPAFKSRIPRGTITVHAGLHAYTTLRSATDSTIYGIIIRCIIPKGTLYIMG